jgi:hypothetical protein
MAKARAKAKTMDAVLVGSVDWEQARTAAYDMIRKLNGEIADLSTITEIKDAYSPMAWLGICQQLRIVTDGMATMRLLTTGHSSAEIHNVTGIASGSIAAYKAWNTMYAQSIQTYAAKRIRIKGRTQAEKDADIAFLRSCGIAFTVEQVAK